MTSSPALRKDYFAGWTRKQFILWVGVVGWGIPTGILWALAMSDWQLTTQLPILLLIALVFFPGAGVVFGWTQWQLRQWMLSRKLSNPQARN